MCGLFGTFQFENSIDLENSIGSLNLLSHRGPDGFGFEYGDFNEKKFAVYHNEMPASNFPGKVNYFLGHRRLSIIDLNDNAFQPLESLDQKYSVIFNGEIYNYIELREELLSLGCNFQTDHSDTEVLLNAYIEWGTECLSKFRGMFAFAIYERETQTLFIARDRIGQKTLYYELSEQHFTFSSELAPMLAPSRLRKINLVALNLYMKLGYIPHPHCIYDGMSKLPPATFALVDLKEKRLRLQEYWDIPRQENLSCPVDEIPDLTREKLSTSVSLRLRSDVSIGAFISGGIDSTLIVKTIAELDKKKFDIFGADFPGTNRSERSYIEIAANKYSQNLFLSDIDSTHVKNIESIVRVFDEPFDGASSIALFDLFGVASKKHKVILTGDGGDEMFAGYDRYIQFPRRESFLKFLRRLVIPNLFLSLLHVCGFRHRRLISLKKYLDGEPLDNFIGFNRYPSPTRLIKPEFAIDNLSKLEPYLSIKAKIREKEFTTVKALQYVELKTILPGRMLYKLDRFSMSYGVEARSPFLDHELAEMAFAIPDSANISNGVTKSVLKALLSKDFEEDYINREKQGFGNPLSNWFRDTKKTGILAILSSKESVIYNYLDYDMTNKVVSRFQENSDGLREKEMWRLLVLAHFLEFNKNLIRHPEQATH